MRYILNSAVVTSPGRFEYTLVDSSQAMAWLAQGPFVSTIGYEETAIALEAITGVRVPVNRQQITMDNQDEALVFRLTARMSDPALKGKLTPEFVMMNCELGILRKIDNNQDDHEDPKEVVRKTRAHIPNPQG